jgi:phosphate-selective porin
MLMPAIRLCALVAASALLSLTSTAAAQADDGSRFEHALLDVLRERGLIGDAEYEELVAIARERAASDRVEVDLLESRLEHLRAPDLQVNGGKPGGLEFRSPDGRWSLGLKGRLQTRVESFNSEDSAATGTSFSVNTARLTVEGQAGVENVTYSIEMDIPTNDRIEDPAKDKTAFLRHAYIDWGFDASDALRFGQFKFPFGREGLIPNGSLSLPAVSIASKEFTPSYEPGAMLKGTLDEGHWEYYAAVANGEGANKNNTAGEAGNGLRDGVRVVWNPLGAMKLDEPAFQTVDDGGTKLALGAAWMRNHDSTGLNVATPGADTTSEGLELHLFRGPWSLLVEEFQRRSEMPAADSVTDRGQTVQLGLFVDRDVWEVVARRSSIDFDAKDDQVENTLGLNWYLVRHAAKWQLDLSTLENEDATADATRVRLQYQAIF